MKTNNSKITNWYYYAKNNYCIILDSSALMNENFNDDLAFDLVRALKSNNKTVCIPGKVVEELKKHQNSNNQRRANGAKRMERTLNYLKRNNVSQIDNISKTEYGSFADPDVLAIVAKGMTRHNILVVTNDKKLADGVLQLGRFECALSKNVAVCNVAAKGLVMRGLVSQRGNHGKTQSGYVTQKRQNPTSRPESRPSQQSVKKSYELSNTAMKQAMSFLASVNKEMPFSKVKREAVKQFGDFCQRTEAIVNGRANLFEKFRYSRMLKENQKELKAKLKEQSNINSLLTFFREAVEQINRM